MRHNQVCGQRNSDYWRCHGMISAFPVVIVWDDLDIRGNFLRGYAATLLFLVVGKWDILIIGHLVLRRCIDPHWSEDPPLPNLSFHHFKLGDSLCWAWYWCGKNNKNKSKIKESPKKGKGEGEEGISVHTENIINWNSACSYRSCWQAICEPTKMGKIIVFHHPTVFRLSYLD